MIQVALRHDGYIALALPRERGRPNGMICLPSRFDIGEGCNFIGSRAIRQPTRGGVLAWGLLT